MAPEKRIEQRKKANLRAKTAASFQPLFRQAAEKIVERETQNVTRAVKKYLGERSLKGFDSFLGDFYRDFQDFIVKQITPVSQSLANAIHPLALDEVKTQVDVQPKVDKFTNDYVTAFASRYAQSSQGQLKSLIQPDPKSDVVDLNAMSGAVQDRLDEWSDTRPDKVAANETVRLGNAVAKLAFVAAGVSTLVWQKTSDVPCEICDPMDGMSVGIDSNFARCG